MSAIQMILDPTLHSPEVQDFEAALRRRVVGQDRAVRRLAGVFQVYQAGLSAPGRPLANLLLLWTDRLREDAHGGDRRRSPLRR